ncbi:MAG: polyphosphate polymerase domain-containing protein [Clostridiales bacterium]|nr:polyphosphate polymerase domain-containing protein [Clostridiales bacterium]
MSITHDTHDTHKSLKDSFGQYRHEYKYIVSAAELELIKTRLTGLMSKDPHTGPDGTYNIRSIYFDDYENSCYYDNENGVDPREKFRIRIYDRSSRRISLELKKKINGKCLKLACPLTLEQYNIIAKGGCVPISADNPEILNKLTLQYLMKGMKPKIIVEYDRMPWIYEEGNVRVTFDKNVRSSTELSGFFDPDIPVRCIMPPGWHLLEVKWDEFLPDFIYKNTMINNLEQTAHSKYYLCKRFSILGGK